MDYYLGGNKIKVIFENFMQVTGDQLISKKKKIVSIKCFSN